MGWFSKRAENQSSTGYDSSNADEKSPLIRGLRGGSSSFEGTYMSMPNSYNSNSGHQYQATPHSTEFRPITYAEKALASLLNGVLMYALCCMIGLLFVSLNFEGMLGDRVNWWLIFIPFWVANLAIFGAHVASFGHVKHLRQWAEVDTMSNEPLLPLLRRILTIYAVSVPLSVLLLWSELAFCARLQDTSSTSLYICYAPLLVIQVAFFIRYLMCRSDSTLPGVCWVLIFVFTFLLAYQTSSERALHPHHSKPAEATADPANNGTVPVNGSTPTTIVEGPPSAETFALSWWTVASPLFAFETLMALALVVVLYNEFAGIYRMTRWQFGASALYLLALVAGVAGQLMMLEHLDYHWGTFFFPSALLFFGLVCASVAMYIVGRHHVQELMATKGGAVPVPLTRTNQGWITSHAVTEHWILFGDIYLTADGLNHRNQTGNGRRSSVADLSAKATPTWKRVWRWLSGTLCCCLGSAGRRDQHGAPGENDSLLTPSDPERRIQNILKRRTSGSYSDIKIELDTPKAE